MLVLSSYYKDFYLSYSLIKELESLILYLYFYRRVFVLLAVKERVGTDETRISRHVAYNKWVARKKERKRLLLPVKGPQTTFYHG